MDHCEAQNLRHLRNITDLIILVREHSCTEFFQDNILDYIMLTL